MKHIKEFIPYVVILIVVIFIRTFIVTPVRVEGVSMEPTLKENEFLLLKKWDKTYDRFDVVVVRYNGSLIIKRIIGLPHEHVSYKNNTLYVNGKKVEENFKHDKTGDFKLEYLGEEKIPSDYYFVMGDNRTHSMDSRMIGLVKKKDIIGITSFRFFPFTKIGSID